ncbi:EAL domain-containing protein [Pseudarthrobacter sp. PS3-L1]|uniref:putative bifunctional diguanylate cyclase/phosphodiesterase n=1 Tax=Pseudarthrobacter sp. PS3-L1 TaxID=3046207 RepID=UPI0024B8C844|nr:EAL domain-containing protein [Pseudarthrobacter sp. PS3-L1]MDJ0322045.1 EAL domain-containing protein [Pseudarthrobacter sp. PS3-L1]
MHTFTESDPTVRGAAERMAKESAFALLLLHTESDRILASNSAADVLFGYEPGGLVNRSIRMLIAGWDPHAVAGSSPFLSRCQQLSGHSFAAEVHLSDPDETPERVVTVRLLTDDTSPAPAQAGSPQLQELVSLLNATLESTADGLLVVSSNGVITGVNSRFATLWGIPSTVLAAHDDQAVMALVLEQLISPDAFLEKVTELYSQPLAESLDVLKFHDGRVFERFSRPQLVADRVVGRVWSFRDITSQRRAEKKAKSALRKLRRRAEDLKQLAYTDPLTGLGNRALFNEVLTAAHSDGEGAGTTVMLLDLDDFKEVNDIHGHQAGDRLLIDIAHKLSGCIPETGTIARLGGDEFVILLPPGIDSTSVAQNLLQTVHQPVDIDGTVILPSLSMGLADAQCDSYPQNAASDLLRRADIAMYAAKMAGKNQFIRFQAAMMEKLVARTELQETLRSAVRNREISPYFQSVHHRDGPVRQYEALARWKKGDAYCPPDIFIAEAEASGFIIDLGAHILDRACREMAPWLQDDPARSIAVNVSGIQIRERLFAERVLSAVKLNGVSPRQLVLEVTESLFLDESAEVIHQLQSLRSEGVRISLDDFGIGYSSFARLQTLPVDTVKLDKSFISVIQQASDRSPVLESMIVMAHNLGLTVTAEGVETELQAQYLYDMGCDYLQGFLYSEAVPAHKIPGRAGQRQASNP